MNNEFLDIALSKQDPRYNYVVIKTIRHGTLFIVKDEIIAHTDTKGFTVGISWEGFDASALSRAFMFVPAEDIALVQIVDWTEESRKAAQGLNEASRTIRA